MQIDNTTYNDISVFSIDEEFSIFHKLNFTRTTVGKEWLKYYFAQPFDDIHKITSTQKVIQAFIPHVENLPEDITNGTIMMISKYLDYDLDAPPANPGFPGSLFTNGFTNLIIRC